jgi:hypothetical protein
MIAEPERPMTAIDAILDRYRCPETFARVEVPVRYEPGQGYFRFGSDVLAYGRTSMGHSNTSSGSEAFDALPKTSADRAPIALPFDPSEVAGNLRFERYAANGVGSRGKTIQRKIYYGIRPLLGVSVRKHLQRRALRGWQDIPFPQWPVDRTVDKMFEKVLSLSMKAHGVAKVPFIWFWPDGQQSCAVMTHDVEELAGVHLCKQLMDMNDSHGIKSAFQLIPEKRYVLPTGFREELRRRGFEVNVHDLNHDGHLFEDETEFQRRASKINDYVREYEAKGFRAGMLYRNLDWMRSLSVSYDMTVPNVGHLDPQRGGCCTIFPYFAGNLLEIPLTTIQDYSLLHVLHDCTTEIWKTQLEIITQHHGLASFNVHPDYINSREACDLYDSLLKLIADYRSKGKLFVALPAEVDSWWRDRSRMTLVKDGDRWKIEGPQRERARVAFACEDGERLRYELPAAETCISYA